VLNGTESPDLISGLGGNDTLYGRGGADLLLGGAGNDNLIGGAGADTLDGGGGDDYLYVDILDSIIGGSGYDTVVVEDLYAGSLVLNLGSAGIERVLASNQADTLNASTSLVAVVLYGFGGADTLVGGAGDDYLYFDFEDLASGTLSGGGGYDYLLNNSSSSFTGTISVTLSAHGAEGYYGGAGAEIISAAGVAVSSSIYTNGGADQVTGSSNGDYIYVDAQTLSVNAGGGYDYIIYNQFDGSGANFVLNAMNAEGAIGREGNDVLDASGVTTSFVTLYGFGGADTLRGGTGNDYIYMDAADLAGGAVQAGAGYDYLINQGATALSITLVNHGAEGFFGSSAAETISAAGLATFATIFSGGGADTITGSAQGDTIYLTNSFASVNAGAGYDYVVYEPLDGTGALNWNLAAMGAEGAIGRDGNDTFNASGIGTFATLYGYGGNDTLIGSSFSDSIYGGTGNDTITSNSGNDLFVFETGWGSDTITDFAVGADRMIMRASGLTQFSQLTVVQSGADTLVSFNGQSVRLQNVTAGTITAASFQFLPAAEDISGDKQPAVSEPSSDTFDFSGLSEDTQQPEASSWISVFGTTPISPALDFLSPEWDSQVQDAATGNFQFDSLALDWQINA
jgi:Ca2+-binding RTX toxin-like protein